MSFIVSVAGSPVPIFNNSCSVTDTLDGRSTATFTVLDSTGQLHFVYGMQVTITDSVLGLVFSGYVSDATETNYPPNAMVESVVNCIDQHYLADKRVARQDYSNFYAGDIVTSLLANYLAAEGVTSSYAEQFTTTEADFATGALTGVAPMLNVGDGDLELLAAGVPITKTETNVSDWASNASITGLDGTTSTLMLASHATLQLTGTCGLNFGNAFVYQAFWNFGYTIQAGDVLTYKVWVNSSSPQIMCGIDFVCSDGTVMRDFAGTSLVDQNGLLAHPKQDLSGFANDQWYARLIPIGGLAGKFISFATIVFEGDSQGTYTGYVSDIVIYASNLTTHHSDLFYTPGTHTSGIKLAANVQIGNNGYSNVSLKSVVGYEQSGTRVSNTTLLTPANIYRTSLINWTQGGNPPTATVAANAIPANTALDITTSIDGQASFQTAANFTAISNLLPGTSLVGRTLQTRAVFSITGRDPIVTPTLSDITWTVTPSYTAIKQDVYRAFTSTADFNLGTKTNVTVLGTGDMVLTNSFRSWIGGSLASQTMFGNGTFSHAVKNGLLGVTVTTTNQAFSRFDFAGTWGGGSDFTASIDLQITSGASWSGLEYMTPTANWSNALNSFAYRADVNASTINLSYGANGVSGVSTPIGSSPVTISIQPNDWHTLTVSYTASSHTHTVSLDGVQYISVVDSHYTAAGNFGASLTNSTGATQTAYYQNFGVMPPACIVPASPIPQWLSPSIPLSTMTVGNSQVLWNAFQPNGAIVNVNAKVNSGPFVACTNGGTIPGLTPGTTLTNGTVQFQVQLQTPNVSVTPIFNGLSVWVLSAYSSSGSRIAPGLNLTPVGRAGSTLVAWNALVPAGCQLFMDTAINNQVTWTNVGSGAVGSAAIAGISGQPESIEDTFAAVTSSFYTQTSQTDGTNAAWVWNTPQSRLDVTGGATALLLNASVTDDDVDLVTDIGMSDAGGLVWRVKDTSNFYDLVVCDPQSASPNQMVLYKVTGNVRTTLGTAIVTWTQAVDDTGNAIRGSIPHRIRAMMAGPLITVSFDGAVKLTFTDNHPLAAGRCGLRNNTFGGQSTATFYYFRIQQLGDSVLNTVVFTRARLFSTDPTASPQLLDMTVSVHSPDIGNGAFIPSTTYNVLNGSTNTIAASLDDLAKQSNYWWRIDKNKKAFFQPHNGTLAPWVLTNYDMLIPYGITVKNAGDLYLNTPWILGGVDVVLQNPEYFPCDGIKQTFDTKYPVESLVSVSVGTHQYSYGVKGVDVGKDFYYQQGSNIVNQDASLTPLPSGQYLTIVYNGQINVVATTSNPDKIASQAQLENTSGINEVAQTAPGLNRAAAAQFAASVEAKDSVKSQILTCTTARVGLAVGQLASVFLPQHQLNDWQGLISGMTTQWRSDGLHGPIDANPYFTITASSGPLLNEWSTTLAGLSK